MSMGFSHHKPSVHVLCELSLGASHLKSPIPLAIFMVHLAEVENAGDASGLAAGIEALKATSPWLPGLRAK